MEKIKEQPKIKDNGEKQKLSKSEMIERLTKEIEELKVAFHQKTGALAYLRELE